MTVDSWITLAVLVVTVGVLVADRLPAAAVLGGAVLALMFTDVIDPEVALSGFSSPAPATIAALYVLAGAAMTTGAFGAVVERVLGARGSLTALTASTAALSAFIPNTPLVAMFAPRVVRWSRRTGHPASRYLMPLSFASILGGVVTLIGTSTNLVVSDLLAQTGEKPLGVFEITPVGLPVAVVGVALLAILAPRLLRAHTPSTLDRADERGRAFQVALTVEPAGPLVGRTIAEAGLRNLEGAYLAMIERAERDGDEPTTLPASPDTVLRAGDLCCFVGEVGRVIDLHDVAGLVSAEHHHVASEAAADAAVFEAVVAPSSRLVGQTLKAVGFRGQYGGAVMAVHRADGQLPGQLGRIQLRAGDVLLILANEDFGPRWRGHSDFSLVAAADEAPPVRRGRAWLVSVAGLGLVVTAATDTLSLFEASIAAALIVIVGGAISLGEARRSVNLDVVVTIAIALSLGEAIAVSGVASEIANVVEFLDRWGGDAGLVFATLVATLALTELLTNNAAAALMFPIAAAVAADSGADVRMLAVAVLIGASCSFLSPVGYQTNLMVYGLGGYRFSDFAKVGLPLTLSSLAVGTVVIPLAFG